MRKTWELIRPTFVLVLVCAVVSGLLALTYNLAGVAELANAAYTEEQLAEYAATALPQADRLELVEAESENEDLKFVYKAANGAGMAVVLDVKGYDSTPMAIMYGLDADGVMQGLTVISNNETPGIGKKVIEDAAYLAGYAGLTEADLNTAVDAVSGATKTSNGIRSGAQAGFVIFGGPKGEGLGQ